MISIRGFSLIEILVALSITALLAAVSFSAISTVKRMARSTYCINSLRQIGTAHLSYTADFDGLLPNQMSYSLTYNTNLKDYISITPSIGACKEALLVHPNQPFTYGHNAFMLGYIGAKSGLSRRMYMMDSSFNIPGSFYNFNLSSGTWFTHSLNNNIWFLDGHTESVSGQKTEY